MKKYITVCAVALAAIAGALVSGCGPAKPTLNVYMWSDYIDLDLVREFEKQNNCKVVIDIFDSNEFMYSKLKAGGTGYDVILPTSYMARVMFEQNMLEKLDHSKLPNIRFVNQKVLADLAIDKKMEYSVPYMLGYTCVAYNKDNVFVYPGGKRDSGIEDAAIVATHLMLAAKDAGVESCWLNFFDPEAVAKTFDLPENEEVLMLLDLGYAAEGAGPLPTHSQRKDLSETVSYI